jgi:transposase
VDGLPAVAGDAAARGGGQLCVDALLALRTTAATPAAVLRARLLRLAASEPYHKIVEALCTHPGVGPLSAIRFVLEIGDIHRCARADSIAHYRGLTPSEYRSGDSVQRGPIVKGGHRCIQAPTGHRSPFTGHAGSEESLQPMRRLLSDHRA